MCTQYRKACFEKIIDAVKLATEHTSAAISHTVGDAHSAPACLAQTIDGQFRAAVLAIYGGAKAAWKGVSRPDLLCWNDMKCLLLM
jgi:hypothetical protein